MSMNCCPKCGKRIEVDWSICICAFCGQPLDEQSEIQQRPRAQAKVPRKPPLVWIIVFLLFITIISISLLQDAQKSSHTSAEADTEIETGEASGRVIDFMGAKLTVTGVSRGNKAARREERGDYLHIDFHLDNTDGREEVFLPLRHISEASNPYSGQSFIGIVLKDGSNSIVSDFRSFFDSSSKAQYSELYKVGEEGDFKRSFDLNPGSIKPNAGIDRPEDIVLVIGELKKDTDGAYQSDFYEPLSEFWAGPFDKR